MAFSFVGVEEFGDGIRHFCGEFVGDFYGLPFFDHLVFVGFGGGCDASFVGVIGPKASLFDVDDFHLRFEAAGPDGAIGRVFQGEFRDLNIEDEIGSQGFSDFRVGEVVIVAMSRGGEFLQLGVGDGFHRDIMIGEFFAQFFAELNFDGRIVDTVGGVIDEDEDGFVFGDFEFRVDGLGRGQHGV